MLLRSEKGTLRRADAITARADLRSVKSMADGYYRPYWGNNYVNSPCQGKKKALQKAF